MSCKTLINSHNLVERIDDKTLKQLCTQCGGKGFYRHSDLTNGIITTEIVNCGACEDGYRYGKG